MSKLGAAAIAVLALILSGCTQDPELSEPPAALASSSAAAIPHASPSAPPEEETERDPVEPREPTATEQAGSIGTNELPASEVKENVSLEQGVEFTVVSAEEVFISAGGPGEVSGPGVAVRIKVRNSSDSALDLGGVVVDLAVGDEPAILSSSAAFDPFSGMLQPGSTASATYAFLLPEGAGGDRVVRVEHNESENVMVVVL